MLKLDLEHDTLEEMFEKLNSNVEEVNGRISDALSQLRSIETSIRGGFVISGVNVAVDAESSDDPTCSVEYKRSSGDTTVLNLSFHGIHGRAGIDGVSGTRGSVIHVGMTTTGDEAREQLRQMTGEPYYREGDIFIKADTFAISQCIKGGDPDEARFRGLGILGIGGTGTIDISSLFTGSADELTLGDGTSVTIVDFLLEYNDEIAENLGYFTGKANEFAMGNGTYLSISDFIVRNVDTIRANIGVVNRDRPGLAPTLPAKS